MCLLQSEERTRDSSPIELPNSSRLIDWVKVNSKLLVILRVVVFRRVQSSLGPTVADFNVDVPHTA